jgi:hypothetical protein
MQLQESQIFAGFINALFSPLFSALLGFLAAFAMYWIKDRDPSTRDFERQLKRLQFWKTFYELEAVAPIKLKVQERCKQTMERAAFWVEALPTKAYVTAKWVAILLMSFASSFVYSETGQPLAVGA